MVVLHENWYPDDRKALLCQLAQKAAQNCPIGAFIEIGCWEGNSTLALANTIAPRTLHAVDHFLGDTDNPRAVAGLEGINPASLRDRDVFAQFMTNVEASGCTNIEVYRHSWRVVAEKVRVLVAFIHLDASHDYESVRDQLRTFLPRMMPGGIMCGDDFLHPGVQRAVTEVLGVPNALGNLWWWHV